jgi:cell division protein FtsZ
MIDEKLGDEVWVTVVATGYGEARPQQRAESHSGTRNGRTDDDRRVLREPRGEPRVSRMRERPARTDLDVPEFIPRR